MYLQIIVTFLNHVHDFCKIKRLSWMCNNVKWAPSPNPPYSTPDAFFSYTETLLL